MINININKKLLSFPGGMICFILSLALMNQRQSTVDIIAIFSSVLMIYYLILSCDEGKLKVSYISSLYFILIIISIPSLCIYLSRNTDESIILSLSRMMPLILIIFSYSVFSKRYLNLYDILPCVVIIACLSSIMIFYNAQSFYLYTSSQLRTNWSNVLGACIPFVFLFKGKYLRILLLLICSVILAIGLKRTGLLVGFISLVIGLFSLENTNKYRSLLISIILILPISFVLFYTDIFDKGFQRLSNLIADGGAGRDSLILMSIDYISNISLLNIITGSGLSAISLVNNHFHSTHNDFLDFLLNFGFFSSLIILFIYARLFYLAIFLHGTKFGAFSKSFLVTFLMYSNASGMHYYYYFFIPLFVALSSLEFEVKELKSL